MLFSCSYQCNWQRRLRTLASLGCQTLVWERVCQRPLWKTSAETREMRVKLWSSESCYCCSCCALLLPLAYMSVHSVASKTPSAKTPSTAVAGRGTSWCASEAFFKRGQFGAGPSRPLLCWSSRLQSWSSNQVSVLTRWGSL